MSNLVKGLLGLLLVVFVAVATLVYSDRVKARLSRAFGRHHEIHETVAYTPVVMHASRRVEARSHGAHHGRRRHKKHRRHVARHHAHRKHRQVAQSNVLDFSND